MKDRCTYEVTENVAACTGPAWFCSKWGLDTERGMELHCHFNPVKWGLNTQRGMKYITIPIQLIVIYKKAILIVFMI